MRWLHSTVILIIVAAVLVFALQNLQSVTVSFLTLKLSAPIAVLIALVYLFGMVTGGSLLALIRWALQEKGGSSNK